MRNRSIIYVVGALFLSMCAQVSAQTTIYDANRWMGRDLNGTARFVGMGGALGALGGDISTIGTNPAGIGIYRSNEVMTSFGFTNIGAKDAGGAKVDKFHGSFDNAGFVFSLKQGNSTALRYVNFAFNYHRMKSFDKNMVMNGEFEHSQTKFIADILTFNEAGIKDPFTTKSLEAKGAYLNSELPWLGILGYNSYLVDPYFEKDNEGKEHLVEYHPYYQAGDRVFQAYTARERGGLHSYDFNVAFNLYDRFYLGATIGAYSVDYRRTSLYKEDFLAADGKEHGGYDLGNEYWVDGNGVDFKLGFIWRPIEYSSFRFGASVHTPTFFSLKEYNNAYIDYNLNKDTHGVKEVVDKYGNGMDGRYEYHLITPWKFNVNAGYTIGGNAALGVEYEYADYSSARLNDPDGNKLVQTNDIRSMMKGVHTFRAGMEWKVAPEFAFRLGYNHVTVSMKSGGDAFKRLPTNSVRTDTEYSNTGATHNYTLGFGYRGKAFYADMAYLYTHYKEGFYAFEHIDLPGTSIANDNHKVILTLGMRF